MADRIILDTASKVYQAADAVTVQALADTTLTVESGEFLSIVGPSGCGKSTLLNLVSGLLRPTAGRVSIGGLPVDGPSAAVSMAFQKPVLLRWLTVLENVLLPARIAGAVTPTVRSSADDLLELVGLSASRDRYPSELSGGMQQRAALARALVQEPQALLMDEPFSALDEFTREQLNDELLRLWTAKPASVLFVTHNIGEAVYLADRVAVMAAGPGRVAGIMDVDLERPRQPSMRQSQRFYELTRDVRCVLDEARAGHHGAVASPAPTSVTA